MVTLTAHGYTVVGKGLAFFFLAWSSLHQFPQKHRHIHSRQLIGLCAMELTVDVATFGVLAVLGRAGVVTV